MCVLIYILNAPWFLTDDSAVLVFGLCLPPFLSSNLPSLGFSLYTMSGSSSQRVQRARESRTRRRASIGQGSCFFALLKMLPTIFSVGLTQKMVFPF